MLFETRMAGAWYQSFLPKPLADGRPLVFALEEFVPVRPGLLPRDDFVEGGDVQDHAVVQVEVVGDG
jgi:hypothetical protein